MNTRLQVEHPVTECTTGLDLVKLQIHIARGGPSGRRTAAHDGHAIEVRLNAEDPDNGFAPAPGAIERFRMLTGPGVRIDTGVAEGDTVPADFDSMIAKIIAYGRTARKRSPGLQRALRESVVVIKGGASNKAFLLELLSRDEVQRGEVHIGWLDHLAANWRTCFPALCRCGTGAGRDRSLRCAVGDGAGAVLCVGRAGAAAGSQ